MPLPESRFRRKKRGGAGGEKELKAARGRADVAAPPDPHVAARPALPRRRTEEAAAA
jgi:hypothetical protein